MNKGKGRGKYSHHPCHRLSVPSANLFWCRHCMQIFEDPIARWRHSRTCKADNSQKQQSDTQDIKNLFVGTHHILFPQKEKTLKKPLSVCVTPGRNPSEDLSCVICSKKFCSLEEMRNHVKYPCYKLPWKARTYSDTFLDEEVVNLCSDTAQEIHCNPVCLTAIDRKDRTKSHSNVEQKDGPKNLSREIILVRRNDDFEDDEKIVINEQHPIAPVPRTFENIGNNVKHEDTDKHHSKKLNSHDLIIEENNVAAEKVPSVYSESKGDKIVEHTKVPLKKRKCIYCGTEYNTEQALIKHNRYPCLLRRTRNLSQRVLRSKSKSTLPNIVPSKKKSPAKRVNRSTSSSSTTNSIPVLKPPHLVLTKKGKKLLKEKRKLLIELKMRTVEKHKKIPCPDTFTGTLEAKEEFFFSLGMLNRDRLPADFKSFDRQEEEKELDDILNKYSSLGILKPVSVDEKSAVIPMRVDRSESCETEDDDCFPSPPILERIDVLKQSGIATEYSDDEDETPPDLELVPGARLSTWCPAEHQVQDREQILQTFWEDLGLKSRKSSEEFGTSDSKPVHETESYDERIFEGLCCAKKPRFSIISPLKNRHSNEPTSLKDLKERHFTDLFLYGLGAFDFDIDKNFKNADEKKVLESEVGSPDKLGKCGQRCTGKANESPNSQSVSRDYQYMYRAKQRVKLPNLEEQFEKNDNIIDLRKSLFESFSEWCHAAKSCNKSVCDSQEDMRMVDNKFDVSMSSNTEHIPYLVTSDSVDDNVSDLSKISDHKITSDNILTAHSDQETEKSSCDLQNCVPLISSNNLINTAEVHSVKTEILSDKEVDVVVSSSSDTNSGLAQAATVEESNLLLHCVDEVADDGNEEVTYIIVKNKLVDSNLITNPLYEDRVTLHASEGECAAQQNLLAQLANSKHLEERPVYHYVFQNNSDAKQSIDPKQMANIILSDEAN